VSFKNIKKQFKDEKWQKLDYGSRHIAVKNQ